MANNFISKNSNKNTPIKLNSVLFSMAPLVSLDGTTQIMDGGHSTCINVGGIVHFHGSFVMKALVTGNSIYTTTILKPLGSINRTADIYGFIGTIINTNSVTNTMYLLDVVPVSTSRINIIYVPTVNVNENDTFKISFTYSYTV